MKYLTDSPSGTTTFDSFIFHDENSWYRRRLLVEKFKKLPPLIGYKGGTFMEAGYIFAPYIPLGETNGARVYDDGPWISVAGVNPGRVYGNNNIT